MKFNDIINNELIIKAINDKGYEEPTTIQSKVIPKVLEGRDIIGRAQTGSGKTAAFALPILELVSRETGDDLKALILVPTRELAIQIGDNFESYNTYLELRIGVIFGGITPKRHIKVMKRSPHILVATPGRLLDLMGKGHVNLNNLSVFVLDEADKMLDQRTRDDVKTIESKLPKDRLNILLSATMSNAVKKIGKTFLKDPVLIQDQNDKIKGPPIEQHIEYIEEVDKAAFILELVKDPSYESILIFTRTKKKADKLCKAINISNIRSKAIHGDKSQNERMTSLELFKSGEVKVLVATDLAARGVDIKGISLVINMDIPSVPETFIHRIGRTGRAGRTGQALSLCSEDEKIYLEAIEKLK